MKIVKVCQKHGELTEEQCFIRTEKRWGNEHKKSFSCKACKKESSDKYLGKSEAREKKAKYKKHYESVAKEKINNTRRLYKMRNRELLNQKETERRHKRGDIQREVYRRQQQRWRDTLDDNYIKAQIASQHGMRQKDVPQWMIEIKKPLIAIKRKILEIKNESDN